MQENENIISNKNLMTDMLSQIAISEFSKITSSRELAKFLEMKYSSLIYSLRLVNKVKLPPRYIDFQIPKKSGGLRQISAPNRTLLFAQRKLAQVLSQIYKPPKAAHGFIKNWDKQNNSDNNRSIVSNARKHKNKSVVLNVDLKDFFPSINGRRVFSLLTKPPFNFNKQVAGLITEICIHDVNKNLPQGAATSPIISNMICRGLDKKLTNLSAMYRISYSRYADDLTFSSTRQNIDEKFIENVIEIINKEGFEINEKKLRIQSKRMRQEVTGLIVNEKVNVERKYVRRIRAMLHNWEVKGLEQCQKEMLDKYKKKHIKEAIPDFDIVLKGMINFLGQVRGKNENADQFNLYTKYLNKYNKLKYYVSTGEFSNALSENNLISEAPNKQDIEETSKDYDLNDILPFIV